MKKKKKKEKRERKRERKRKRDKRGGRSGVPLSRQKIPAKIACMVHGRFPARRKNRNVLDSSIYRPISTSAVTVLPTAILTLTF